MELCTLTMAGQQAIAGAARLRAGSGIASASPLAAGSSAVHGAYGHSHAATWTVETVAEPTTFAMVFDGKNRPTRQPSERSP